MYEAEKNAPLHRLPLPCELPAGWIVSAPWALEKQSASLLPGCHIQPGYLIPWTHRPADTRDRKKMGIRLFEILEAHSLTADTYSDTSLLTRATVQHQCSQIWIYGDCIIPIGSWFVSGELLAESRSLVSHVLRFASHKSVPNQQAIWTVQVNVWA